MVVSHRHRRRGAHFPVYHKVGFNASHATPTSTRQRRLPAWHLHAGDSCLCNQSSLAVLFARASSQKNGLAISPTVGMVPFLEV